MTTQSKVNGFIIINGQIEPINYAEYLIEYWNDEVTSPRGVEGRLFIEEVESEDCATCGCEVDSCDCEEFTNQSKYRVREWSGSRSYIVDTFDSEEDALQYIMDCRELYYQKSNTNAPPFFYSYEEAVESIESNHLVILTTHTH